MIVIFILGDDVRIGNQYDIINVFFFMHLIWENHHVKHFLKNLALLGRASIYDGGTYISPARLDSGSDIIEEKSNWSLRRLRFTCVYFFFHMPYGHMRRNMAKWYNPGSRSVGHSILKFEPKSCLQKKTLVFYLVKLKI